MEERAAIQGPVEEKKQAQLDCKREKIVGGKIGAKESTLQ